MSPALSLFVPSLLALGALTAAYPIKFVDYSDNGDLCDTSVEMYMQVETYDYHDNPKVIMTWRQLTGPCGAAVSNPVEFSSIYDWEAGDDLPDEDGKVKLQMYVCAPFGEYELELIIASTSAADSTLEQKTTWEIEYGENEYHIWDTGNTDLADDVNYSPKVPGTYIWPLAGATGFYSTLYSGPLPPILCSSSVPAGTEYKGCYADSSTSRTFSQDQLNLPGKENPTGMTPQECSDYCAAYDYFGLEFGYECFCGTASEFASATESSNCGSSYQYLCTGDSTVTCGGINAISIYERTTTTSPPVVTPAPVYTPAPVDAPTPAPMPSPTPSSSYTYEGCFVDSKSNRIMSGKTTLSTMSAEICYDICNDGVNNYFGTQFSNECWCGVDTDLTANGEEAIESECDMECQGTTGEICGDRDRMSAYKIGSTPTYIGCYGDGAEPRAMPAAGMYSSADMTNEVCWARCSSLGYAYAGTQWSEECWCDDSFDTYGTVDSCDFPCSADSDQFCGGFYALSVYEL